ncbi:MAG TPA: translation initiation factor IF-2 [Patescibacteria group bacterium]
MAKILRPPIVTVLGHVDHGKTSLLDAIRKTNVAAREHGGITQKIGAYQIEFKGKKITFIDTPGHAAFEKMRSRGASVADIAILVIAAEEGLKPQTNEAIKHIKNANIPMIVAINKIDLEGANPAKVKEQLAAGEVLVEGYGGDVPVVEVSAKTGKNLDELLEMINLLSDVSEIKADPQGNLEAVVIESALDKSRGPVATLVVKNGTLKVGDEIYSGAEKSKIRALISDNGKNLQTAEPSVPVEILGFKTVPAVGAIISTSPQVAGQATSKTTSALEVLQERELGKNKLRLIIKADTAGTLEAIEVNLPKDEVMIIKSQTGEVGVEDVQLAKTTDSKIYAFNVKIPPQVLKLADNEKVALHSFRLIYDLFDQLDKDLENQFNKKIESMILAEAKVVASFDINGQRIAGCKVIKGEINKGSKVRLTRGKQEIGWAEVSSLKRKASDVSSVSINTECGIGLSPNLDFQVGDKIELVALN